MKSEMDEMDGMDMERGENLVASANGAAARLEKAVFVKGIGLWDGRSLILAHSGRFLGFERRNCDFRV